MNTAVNTTLPGVIPNFARSDKTYVKPNTSDLDDDSFIKRIPNVRLISRICELMQSENVDQIEVLTALYECKNREDLEELYEDMVLGRIMEERENEPSESMSIDEDIIMQFLRSR